MFDIESKYDQWFNHFPKSIGGRLWTIVPTIIRPENKLYPETYWEYWFEEEGSGRVGVHGYFHEIPGSKELAIIIHGLAGSPDGNYVINGANDLCEQGISTLRLGLRGSRGIGGDIYYAACTEDIAAALRHPLFAEFESIYIVGYSMGGHIAIHSAVQDLDPRVKGVITICSPLDLRMGSQVMEHPTKILYRYWVVIELKNVYRLLIQNNRLDPDALNTISRPYTSLRQFDSLVTAPRWGYYSAEDYYERASAGRYLDQLKVPVVYLYAKGDPMVPSDTIEPYLAKQHPNFYPFCIENGGHVYLQTEIDLGIEDVEKRLYPQALELIRRTYTNRLENCA